MATIPTEIVESCILPRLPVKTLFRFKCVSKSWQTLISSSNFFHLHQRHANRLLLNPGYGHTLLQVHNLDSPLEPPSLCPYPNKQLPRQSEDTMTILASCEFFVLVGYSSSLTVERLFLLNPSTLSYHTIILSQSMKRRRFEWSYFLFGLYYDEANDDCKVVSMARCYSINAEGWEVEIYSCKTNSWRLIEHKLISEAYHCIYFNSVLYFVIPDSSNQIRIRCFDIQIQQWIKDDILFPHILIFPEVCIFDGSLCILGTNADNKDECRTMTYCMWVLNESSGVKESWVKLMSIVPENPYKPNYHPLVYRKGSQHELLCRRPYDLELFWYDLKHKIATRAEFSDEFNDGARLPRCSNVDHICKESLVNFSWWPNRSH